MAPSRLRAAISTATAVVIIVVIVVAAGIGSVAILMSPSATTSSSIPSSTSSIASSSATQPTTSTSSASTTTSAAALIKLSVASAVGVSSPQYAIPMLVGVQEGIFKTHGFDVSWTPFNGGGPMYQAAASGSASIGETISLANIDATLKGVPVKCVAIFSERNLFEVFVNGNSSIRSIQQLNGTTVGISSLAGEEQILFVNLALKYNIKLSYVATGGPPGDIAFLKRGQISAFVLNRLNVLDLMRSGQVRSILAVTDFVPKNWQEYCLYATEQFIQQHPDQLKGFISAYLDALAYIANNQATAANDYAKAANLNNVTYALELVKAIDWHASGTIDSTAFQSMLNFYISSGVNVAITSGNALPASKLYDQSFLPQTGK